MKREKLGFLQCLVNSPGNGGRLRSQPLQVISYRAGHEIGEIVREDRKESEDHSLDSQSGVAAGLPGGECF